jgi:hypothetical protein
MPQLGPGYPSSTAVFVPNWEASGRLAIGYSRNANQFHLPKYAEYRESDQSVGLYLKLTAQEAARVVTTQEFEWPDGQVRPLHEDGLESFQFLEFRTHRYDYGFRVGYMTRNQAAWPLVEWHKEIHAAQCMTARTIRMLSVLTTSTNWTIAGTGSSGTGTEYDMSSDHTGTASALAGGYLNLGTSSAPYIKIAFDKIEALVNLDSLGTVERDKMMCMINTNQARLWAESSEIHEYIKGSYWAKEELAEGLQPNNKYGLPSSIYGMKILVENCVRVTSRKGATLAKSLAMPDQTAVFVSRIGGLDGAPVKGGKASPSFTTATMFWYEDEMTSEDFDDPKNRLTEGHITENTSEQLTSPISGYYLTSTTSVAS